MINHFEEDFSITMDENGTYKQNPKFALDDRLPEDVKDIFQEIINSRGKGKA